MIYLHTLDTRHARMIALYQGWYDADWTMFTLEGVRGITQPVIVTCNCVPAVDEWTLLARARRAIIVTIVCPRCVTQGEVPSTVKSNHDQNS